MEKLKLALGKQIRWESISSASTKKNHKIFCKISRHPLPEDSHFVRISNYLLSSVLPLFLLPSSFLLFSFKFLLSSLM